jgi:ribonuclease P protein component
MAAPSWPGGEPRAAINLPSATNAPSGTPSSVEPFLSHGRDLRFPKSARVLRRSDFRKIYDHGSRFSCAYFAAFCLASSEQTGPRVGFTVSRAAGSAVVRNRMKRRIREAVRLHLPELPPRWSIVFNPRKPLLEADFDALEREVSKVFARCANS